MWIARDEIGYSLHNGRPWLTPMRTWDSKTRVWLPGWMRRGVKLKIGQATKVAEFTITVFETKR